MKREALLVGALSIAFLALCTSARAQVSFFQPPTYSGGGYGSEVRTFAADFNGDGKPDILVSDGTLNLGNGDGTFRIGTPVTAGTLAVADFNGDGRPDILQQGTGTLLVLLGNGDGTFQAPISTASGASLQPVAAIDLNGDGKADAVGIFNNSLVVYISKGDGTFAPGVSYSLGVSSVFAPVLSLGDFNGDGNIDIVVSTTANSPAAGTEVVFLGKGDGTFQAAKASIGISSIPAYAAAGDFNGDGKLDLALSYAVGSVLSPSVYVLLGNGDGTFQVPAAAFAGAGPVAAADFNGDGRADLVVEDGRVGFGGDCGQIYLGNADGTLSNASSYVFNFFDFSAVTGIVTADFNGDGKLDFATGNAVLLGNGDGTFQGIQLGVPGSGVAVIGKFDNGGMPDVAVVSGSTVNILSENANGMLSVMHTYTLRQAGVAILVSDLNGDGDLDLVVIGSDSVSWSYSVLLGNGDGSFQSPVFSQESGIGGTAAIADFNNDKKPDLAVVAGNQTVGILLGNGDGTFGPPAYYYNAGGGVVLTADFNGDGKIDIASGAAGPKTAILFGNGDGTFQPAVFPSSLNGFESPAFTADLNNDGNADLIGLTAVALGNGDGTFTVLPDLGVGLWAADVADLNGDGKPDLIATVPAQDHTIQSGVLLGNGDGTFGPIVDVPNATPFLSPQAGNSFPSSVLVGDINGDGRPDILFSWPGTISGIGVLINTTVVVPGFALSAASGAPTSQTVSAGQSSSFSLVLAPTGSFTGTVNFTCAITPAVSTAPPICSLPSSLQISGIDSQPLMVKVSTTAAVTADSMPPIKFPRDATPWVFFLLVGSCAYLWQNRQRMTALAAAPIMILALATCVGCGGSSSSAHIIQGTTPGTPAGTYTATVTATSGTISNKMALTVVVP